MIQTIKEKLIAVITPFAVIAACVAVGYSWVLNIEMDKLAAQNQALHVVNQQNAAAVGAIIELRSMTVRVLNALDKNRQILEASDRDSAQKLAELAKINQDVKTYLTSGVPVDVRRLLVESQNDKRNKSTNRSDSNNKSALQPADLRPTGQRGIDPMLQ